MSDLGGEVVFARSVGDSDIRIYTADGDGSHERVLVNLPGLDMDPKYSPHGTAVLFRHNASQAVDGSDVFVLQQIGGKPVNLTHSASRGNWGASWTIDGRSILFNRRSPERVPEVWTMRADGTGGRRVVAGWGEYPVASPDGSRIAFESRRDGNYEIYTVRSDGTGLTRLTTDPADDKNPQWLPSGDLVFASERDSTRRSSTQGGGFETARQIYTMRPNGSHQRPIFRDRSSDEQLSVLADGRVLFFSIIPADLNHGTTKFNGAFVADVSSGSINRVGWLHDEVELSQRLGSIRVAEVARP